MPTFASNVNIYIQVFMAVIVIGMSYSLWSSTKVYGGIIGSAIRYFGLGMVFITVSILEKVLITLTIIPASLSLALAQDFLNMIALILLAAGFSKLATGTKI